MEEQEIGELLKSWFVASMFSLACPVILTLLIHSFPSIADSLCHKEYPWMPRNTTYDYGIAVKSLLVILPVMVYWSVGLATSRWLFNRHSCWRTSASLILLASSISSLFFIVPMLSTVWSLAMKMGVAPHGSYEGLESMHGPWKDMHILEEAVMVTICLPLISFFLSLLSFVFRPNWFSAVIWGVNPFIFFLLFISHFWLID